MAQPGQMAHAAIRLTGRARVNHGILVAMGTAIVQGICLHEAAGIAWLRHDVYACYFKPGPVIPHRCTTGAAEEIKQPWPHRAPSPGSRNCCGGGSAGGGTLTPTT